MHAGPQLLRVNGLAAAKACGKYASSRGGTHHVCNRLRLGRGQRGVKRHRAGAARVLQHAQRQRHYHVRRAEGVARRRGDGDAAGVLADALDDCRPQWEGEQQVSDSRPLCKPRAKGISTKALLTACPGPRDWPSPLLHTLAHADVQAPREVISKPVHAAAHQHVDLWDALGVAVAQLAEVGCIRVEQQLRKCGRRRRRRW